MLLFSGAAEIFESNAPDPCAKCNQVITEVCGCMCVFMDAVAGIREQPLLGGKPKEYAQNVINNPSLHGKNKV